MGHLTTEDRLALKTPEAAFEQVLQQEFNFSKRLSGALMQTAQGGVLSQEDLARALQVDVRTIRRDVRALKQAGHVVLTRGQVKGVGRGQSHKVRIIEWWLEREGYDQIARRMYHSPQAIKRYVSTFLRVVVLHRQETALEEIAFLTQSSVRLVQDYLAVYEAALQVPHRAEKLQEELSRVSVRERSADGERQKGGPQP
jgi:DeoR/GlpR family transcriptional regulator of sugar metabolism